MFWDSGPAAIAFCSELRRMIHGVGRSSNALLEDRPESVRCAEAVERTGRDMLLGI